MLIYGGYALDNLAEKWLQEKILQYYDKLLPYLGKTNKDYGAVPGDILGEYGCQDVLTNRRLWKYIASKCPEQCYGVWQTEIALTRRLFEMERNGLRVDLKELKITEFKILNRMIEIDNELTRIVGRSFRPHVSEDCFEVLCGQYGLPILAYTKDKETGEETGNPSFDKHALRMYLSHPMSPKEVITRVDEFRHLNQLNNLFVAVFQDYARYSERNDCHLIHTTTNQTVRTGRMSMSEPNMQQNSKASKKLIHPKPGYAFISIDYSQIEYRFIAHYIEDEKVIKAFNEDPDIDYHQLVANFCGVTRQPAKSLNFGMAFGEGKKKLTKQLATNQDIVGAISTFVDSLIAQGRVKPADKMALFNKLAIERATDVYNTYHKMLPTLKPTTRKVENALKERGYIFNMYGRRRRLPYDKAYRGFNNLNQSSAADLIKERTVALCEMIDGTPIELCCLVHDETLLQAPIEIAYDPRTILDLVLLLEHPPIKLRVPIRCACGISVNNWNEASSDDMQQPFTYAKSLLRDRHISQFTNLAHLRGAAMPSGEEMAGYAPSGADILCIPSNDATK
jgi:DNA polymerase-1